MILAKKSVKFRPFVLRNRIEKEVTQPVNQAITQLGQFEVEYQGTIINPSGNCSQY